MKLMTPREHLAFAEFMLADRVKSMLECDPRFVAAYADAVKDWEDRVRSIRDELERTPVESRE